MFLLKEDGGKLLKEDGGGILLGAATAPVVLYVFPVPAATLESVLASQRYDPVIRIQIMEGDLSSVIHEVPMAVISGSVSRDRRRTVTAQGVVALVNEDGLYDAVNPSSLIWPGRIVRVERGAVVDGTPTYRPLMTGLLSKPAYRYGESAVSFTVWSRLRLLDRPFPLPLSFAAGTSLATVVRTVCELGGLGTSDALYDLSDNGAALQVPRSFDVTENMLSELSTFCFDHGLDGPYDNGLGHTILRPFTAPTEQDVAWTFAPGQFSILNDLEWSLEERGPVVYNRQDVVGVAPDRYPVYGSWRDLNPSSPTYNPVDGSGPLGDLPAPPYVSADIHTAFVANQVAVALGYERGLADLPIRARAVPIPMLTERDVVRFSSASLDETARLDTISWPLGPGESELTAQGVRPLVAP